MPDTNTATSVLIVGDWVVDEYWFLVRHHSQMSSHIGLVHYRVSSEPNEAVSDLCGAGHVARVLYELRLRNGQQDRYKLFGWGNWYKRDTVLLKHLVHGRNTECPTARASYHLTPESCPDPPNICLRTLTPEGHTIRVIRHYHQVLGGRVEQLNRIDWESQTPRDLSPTQLLIPDVPTKVDHIVVYDLKRGVITEDLIGSLKQRYSSAKWYVWSKEREVKWLAQVTSSLELFMVGPEVASILNPWDSWLKNTKPTLQALKLIQDTPGNNVVVLSDAREIVMRLNPSGHCLTLTSTVSPTALNQLGWSSAFFAALIHQICCKTSRADLQDADALWAFEAADELGGVPVPKSVGLTLPHGAPPAVSGSSTWADEQREWDQARQGYGIITNSGAERLELWRAEGCLPGYIACIREKQETITNIARHLKAFQRSGPSRRSLSILLQADPGAGKTSLAKALSKAFSFAFLGYDVTQMMHRDELLDIFDDVATLQANGSDWVFVVVDEINALLDAAHVYGSFLAPLEEGFYVRRRSRFTLKPCVWLFAGTQLNDDELEKGEKLSDFKSRMTYIANLDYSSLQVMYGTTNEDSLDSEARLEQVYLGATMIKARFPGVREISRAVLQQFHALQPAENPARMIRKLAGSLTDVQYGRVTSRNCENWRGVEWRNDNEDNEIVRVIG